MGEGSEDPNAATALHCTADCSRSHRRALHYSVGELHYSVGDQHRYSITVTVTLTAQTHQRLAGDCNDWNKLRTIGWFEAQTQVHVQTLAQNANHNSND